MTVGEWMPIRFYRNDGSRLRDVTRVDAASLDARLVVQPRRRRLRRRRPSRPRRRQPRAQLHLHDVQGQPVRRLRGRASPETSAPTSCSPRRSTARRYPLAGMVPLGREIYQLGAPLPDLRVVLRRRRGADVRPAGARAARSTTRPTPSPASCCTTRAAAPSASHALPTLAQIAPIKAIVVARRGRRRQPRPGRRRQPVRRGAEHAARRRRQRALAPRRRPRATSPPCSPRASGFLAPRNVAGLALLDTPAGKTVLVANTGDRCRPSRSGRAPSAPER